MSKNTSIALGEHFQPVHRRPGGTRTYGNASEVVRAGLRLLEEQESG
ncbi:MAG: type II toxin-antitoxin system ParD family antitoxin [Rhizobiaceae bacterium]|nr:type II toxin-antitoxin system ParD family antitoxin [Rhizobiaceae bacterium]